MLGWVLGAMEVGPRWRMSVVGGGAVRGIERWPTESLLLIIPPNTGDRRGKARQGDDRRQTVSGME